MTVILVVVMWPSSGVRNIILQVQSTSGKILVLQNLKPEKKKKNLVNSILGRPDALEGISSPQVHTDVKVHHINCEH